MDAANVVGVAPDAGKADAVHDALVALLAGEALGEHPEARGRVIEPDGAVDDVADDAVVEPVLALTDGRGERDLGGDGGEPGRLCGGVAGVPRCERLPPRAISSPARADASASQSSQPWASSWM